MIGGLAVIGGTPLGARDRAVGGDEFGKPLGARAFRAAVPARRRADHQGVAEGRKLPGVVSSSRRNAVM